MNLGNIMLSERSQTTKATYCMVLFIGNVQNRQIFRDRKISGHWGRGMTANRFRVSLWNDENVLKLDSGDGCTTLNYTKNHWIVYLKGWLLWFVTYFSKTKGGNSICRRHLCSLGLREQREWAEVIRTSRGSFKTRTQASKKGELPSWCFFL